eukprot:TRINITY_DN325_c1_g2_i2.p1 TRINITY_DN325_c1_g2~~TRINITY_DN325_c1_g2_i2.p1  ORF type:complete len:545 (+),score=85.56 TRINITY_DN325_c1_g2_i2:298-1932(+)
MDEYTGKRTSRVVGISSKGSSASCKDSYRDDRSIQYCNRLGCSTRVNSMKGSEIANQEKAKYSRASFHSTSSKAVVGSSSTKPFSGVSNQRKSHHEQPSMFLKEKVHAESSRQAETKLSVPTPTTAGHQTRLTESKDSGSAVLHEFSMSTIDPVRSDARPQKQTKQQSGMGNSDTSLGSTVRSSFASRNTNRTTKSASQGVSVNANRYGLRNLRCTSISDILPPHFSSSDSGDNRRSDIMKKRCTDKGESSSARSKNISGLSTSGNSLSILSCSPPERPLSQQTSRRARSWAANRDGVASVRTRREIGETVRPGLPEQVNDNVLLLPETVVDPPLPQTEFSISEVPTVGQNSNGRPPNSSGTFRNRAVARLEDSTTRPFHRHSVDRDGYRRFNMEGIAEVLLALERIEQDEELTYEQLMALESNLFLGGLSFIDQHRDMRLDIDNMSYEELLALEETMGTVSTALPEEALSSCLKRSFYTYTQVSGVEEHGNEDTKCSICQEEYIVGEEVGKLGCEHQYHVTCIHQWLRQKNWCPICRAPASSS